LLIPSLDEVYQSVTESIEYAEASMSKTRTSVEKAQASKENRNKVVSKASEIVNALLEPASQVVNLLDGIGALFPPCKLASNILAVCAISAASLICNLTECRP
jgi:isopropylmalate/homocitrate/citramalate synthase